MTDLRLIHADARRLLEHMEPGSVDVCCTSPPYFGLRSYRGVDPATDPGAQDTVEGYIGMLMDVFREVWKALKPTGVLWVNCGDSMYSGSGARPYGTSDNLKPGDLIGVPWRLALALQQDGWTLRMDCIWAKDSPMPESVGSWRWEQHRVKVKQGGTLRRGDAEETGIRNNHHDTRGLAGWQSCPGCETCEPNGGLVLRRGSWRPTRAHEYLFMFTKGLGYFAEQESVKEVATRYDNRKPYGSNGAWERDGRDKWNEGAGQPQDRDGSIRNPRSVRSFSRKGDGKKFEHYACVDEGTEILTSSGWRRYDELNGREQVAQYDMTAKMLRFDDLEGVYVNKVTNQRMIHAQNARFDMLLTPDHRCVIYVRHPQKRYWRDNTPHFVQADKLRPSHGIPQTACWEDIGTSPITEEWAELLGWFLAEGHIPKRQNIAVEIYQSASANPHKVERLEYLLDAVGADWDKAIAKRLWKGQETQQAVFRVMGFAGARFRELAPQKRLTGVELQWHPKLIEALLEGLIAGDGNKRDGNRAVFVQKDKHTCDIVQGMLLRIGRVAHLRERAGGVWTVFISNSLVRTLRSGDGKHRQIGEVEYTGVVWCPKTKTGTWLARRKGRPFITGNSFPVSLPEWCIRASTPSQGVCSACGAPVAPVVEYTPSTVMREHWAYQQEPNSQSNSRPGGFYDAVSKVTGHRATCDCQAGAVPATVLDCFMGTGSTLVAAVRLGRRAIGVDASEEYVRMARERCQDIQIGGMV